MSKKILLLVGLLVSILSVKVSCMDPDYLGSSNHLISVGALVGATAAAAGGAHLAGAPDLFIAAGLGGALNNILIVGVGGDEAIRASLQRRCDCSPLAANFGYAALATVVSIFAAGIAQLPLIASLQ